MKKCNSVIFLLIFLIGFVGLLTMLNVRAEDSNISGIGGEYGGGSSSSSNPSDEKSDGNGTLWITDSNGQRSFVYGLRVSFIKSDGTNLGSKDYIRDNTYYTYGKDGLDKNNLGIYNRLTFSSAFENGAKVYLVGSKLSKVAYSSSKKSIDWIQIENNTDMYKHISPLSDFINIFSEFGTAAQSIDTKVESNNYTGMFDFFIGEDLNDKKNQERIYNAFNNLFKQVTGTNKDIDDDEYKTDGDLFDLFLVFEPVTLLEMKGTGANSKTHGIYLGTAYELASWSWSLKGNYSGFSDVVSYTLPCASYLNGQNLVNSIPSSSSLKSKFNTQTYFNGNINISVSGTNSQACYGNGLGDKVRDSSSDVGMGIIWLSSYIKTVNDCQYIKDNIVTGGSWSSLERQFDSLYNSGGVNNILNRYASIEYKDSNGKNQEISGYWFVHQCTCYGIYDYYEDSISNTYTKNNQSAINNISRIFGDQNWYVPPSLSEVYQGAFQETKFLSYYLLTIRNATALGLEDLSWERFTEEKFRELNCGVSSQNWCAHYEQWHNETISKYSNLSGYPTINQIKNASEEIILSEYKDQFQTMLDAYNLRYSQINGFSWTINETGTKKNSYIDMCLGNTVASCAEINQFYNNKINSNLNCETVRNFDFSAFNKSHGTNITGNWYANNCGCVEVAPKDCTPSNNIGTCLDDGTISYRDSSEGLIDDEYWNSCVFNDDGEYDINVHKVSDKNSSLTYYDSNLSNEYCEIYCIEDVTATLPSRNITVEAGRWFTIGNGYVNGSRTCRTKSIDWEQFEADLKEANNSGNVTAAKNIVNKMKSCYFNIDESLIENNYEYNDLNGDGRVTASDYLLLGRFVLGLATPTEEQKQLGDVNKDGELNEEDYELFKKYILNIDNTVEYQSTFEEDDLYKVDPKATIIYSDNTYTYQGELKANTTYGEITNELIGCVKKTVKVGTEEVELYDCSNGYATATRTAKTTFSLNEGVYQYVLKKNNLSVHAYEISNYTDLDFTNNYINIGFSNFPVSYSTKAGIYGTMHNQGQFDINYSNLGHVNGTRSSVDTILSTVNNATYGKWECEYSVYDGLIPDPDENKDKGGINVIYRPIDLITPFPDIDASNRETGSNWCGSNGDCSYDNDVVIKYINNNRGVDDYELYQQEPMYTFILTPSVITEIRRYNKENSYASYTGTLNGKSYDYKCQNGRTCISDYLTYLIDITGAKNQSGTCVADQFRSYNDSTSFENCRY